MLDQETGEKIIAKQGTPLWDTRAVEGSYCCEAEQCKGVREIKRSRVASSESGYTNGKEDDESNHYQSDPGSQDFTRYSFFNIHIRSFLTFRHISGKNPLKAGL